MSFLNILYIKLLVTARGENGQTLIEYAFLLLLIAIVVILMVKGLGGTANNTFSKVNSAFQ
jgi:pilus assembly protein Flp/PilA